MKQFKKLLLPKLNDILKSISYPEGIDYNLSVTVAYCILRASASSEDEEGYVEISKSMFENLVGERSLGKKRLYSAILLLLQDNGIISVINNAHSGIRCNSYKINDDMYDDRPLVEVVIESDYLNKKTKKIIEGLDKENNDKRKQRVNCSKLSINYLYSMQYDTVAALEYLEYLYTNKVEYKGKLLTPRTRQNLELKIKLLGYGNTEPEKYRTVGVLQTNGRVNSDITDLRTDFRQFVIGNDLHIFDINNSQPLLINVLIDYIKNPLAYPALKEYLTFIFTNAYSYSKKSKINKDDIFASIANIKLPNDKQLLEFKKITESGKFYEFFIDWFWRNDYNKYENAELYKRDNMKDKIFTMFYSDFSSTEFGQVFNTLNKFIDDVKKVFIDISIKQDIKVKKARMFAVMMQSVESLLWVQTIQKLLDESNIKYYGIHDSVIVEGKDKAIVESIIRKVYNDYQLNPTIDIKPNTVTLIGKTKKIETKKDRIGIEGLFN